MKVWERPWMTVARPELSLARSSQLSRTSASEASRDADFLIQTDKEK